ncbi:MAG: hypothetical protein JWR80_5665 [Bradyrhizobium sp.]|nr:hypothetical protein [Bradyrhizobium sp.]
MKSVSRGYCRLSSGLQWPPPLRPAIIYHANYFILPPIRSGRVKDAEGGNATAMVLVVLFIFSFSSVAESSQHQRFRQGYGLHPSCNIIMPCVVSSTRGATPASYFADPEGRFGAPGTWHPNFRKDFFATPSHGLSGSLAAKVSEIVSSCGSKVISGVRHTRIAGTRHMSLHTSGKAVDMSGNPSCIYSALSGWPGGYSTDYGHMGHVHISYDPDGGREMGLRFRHGGHRRHPKRHYHRAA